MGYGERQVKRRRLVAAVVVALALGLVACGSDDDGSDAGSGGRASWVHGVVTPKGDAGYVLMARERGFYERQGVNVQIKAFVGNVQLVQALISGAVDSIESTPGPIFDASLKGANVKIVGSTLPTLTYALVAKDEIERLEDLEGKTIGVSAPGALPDELARAMMAEEGVDAGGLEVLNAGNDAQRVQALLGGRIDAAAVSSEFVPQIEKKPGFHVLTHAQDVVPDFPRFYTIANARSLQGKGDAAVRFLAGEMQGLCYAVEHPDAAAALAGKTLKVAPTAPNIAYVQEQLQAAGAVSPTSAIPMAKLEYLQRVRLDSGAQQREVDFGKLVDASLRDKALARAKLSRACRDDPNATGSA